MIFFGMAAHYAMRHECDLIAAGVRIWDTTAYNDATVGYMTALERLFTYSGAGETKRELYLPLINSHDPIVGFLRENKEQLNILSTTWSCWRNGEEPCGDCAPCRTRREFFAKYLDKLN